MRFAAPLSALLTVACVTAVPTLSPSPRPTTIASGQSSGDPQLGIGETLIVLVAGTYPTRIEAEAAAVSMRLGDGLGWQVDEAKNYRALARYAIEEDSLRFLGPPGPFVQWPAEGWLALTAFRTRAGAHTLMPRIRVAELEVQAWQVVKIGGGYVGLGRELHPDGSGPLTAPLADQERYQR